MSSTRRSRLKRSALLLLLLMPAACATQSSVTPAVVVSAPELTPLPPEIAQIEPPPSGAYLDELTRSRREWRKLLTVTPTRSGS